MSNSEKHVEQVRQIFDQWAGSGRGDTMGQAHEITARPAFDRLQLKAGERYLDIGCGIGYSVRWAADVDGSVWGMGIDAAPQMIERAQALSQSYNNVEFKALKFPEQFPPEAGKFDAIFSMEALYYFPDLHGALVAIAALLNKGGRFACLIDFYEENSASHSWPEQLGIPMTLLSESGWKVAFEKAGLKVVELTRLRAPSPENADEKAQKDWKAVEGSLLIVGIPKNS